MNNDWKVIKYEALDAFRFSYVFFIARQTNIFSLDQCDILKGKVTFT